MKINERGYWEETKREEYGWSPKLANWISSILDKKYPVYDFGCGAGDYSTALSGNGFLCTGLEGSPMKIPNLSFKMIQADLTTPLDWLRESIPGSVICLEVLEHIPSEYESVVLTNILNVCNGRLVVSWAIPGQGGDGHINEKSNANALILIESFGFKVNAKLSNEGRNHVDDCCPWFKNTVFVFDRWGFV